MARYLVGVTFEDGADPTPMDRWTPQEVQAHLDHYTRLHDELVSRGELVESTILTGPDLAIVVRSDGTAPVVTTGPFAEFTEWLAGYQVVDVDSEARAVEIAAAVSAVPGRGGRPTGQPVHLRRIMDDSPADPEGMAAYLDTAKGRP